MKIAVLISNKGTGTNLLALFEAGASICAVISDTEDAPGLIFAKERSIETLICTKKENLLPILRKINPDYVCLAGWKQIISDDVIREYEGKILNLHPGLIPDTLDGVEKNPDGTDALWNKGLLAEKAVKNFLDAKATYAGSSIHFLTFEFDFGHVLARTFIKILPGDTVNTLYPRLKKAENKMYADVVSKLT